MNLSQLRYIVEVDKTGSISRAAQNLYVGQPNLSKSIRELENELGIVIFKRTPKGTQATSKGEDLLKYARKVVSQVDEIESIYSAETKLPAIKFGVCVPRATYYSVAFTKFLNKLAPNDQLEVYFKEADATTSMNHIINGDVDFSIIRYHDIYDDYFMSIIRDNALKFELLREYKMQLLMSKDHPLVKYDDVPYHLLNDYIEIIHGDYDVRGLTVSKVKPNVKINPPMKKINIYDRGSQLDILCSVSGTFMWASPIPKDFLEAHGLVMRSCSLASELNKDILIYKDDYRFETYRKLFIETVQSEIKLMNTPKY